MRENQSKIDSFMESITNTAVGFVIAMVTWRFISWLYGMNTSTADDLGIVGIFTVISVVRQYVLRRLFNGRSVWTAIKGAVR